eukprot:gene13237-biopygen11053
MRPPGAPGAAILAPVARARREHGACMACDPPTRPPAGPPEASKDTIESRGLNGFDQIWWIWFFFCLRARLLGSLLMYLWGWLADRSAASRCTSAHQLAKQMTIWTNQLYEKRASPPPLRECATGTAGRGCRCRRVEDPDRERRTSTRHTRVA